MRSATVLLCLCSIAAAALSQEPPKAATPPASENVLVAHNQQVYEGVKSVLLRAAEKMPEENYNFRPTEAVRSFGQVLGHVADAQYLFCSNVLGEKNPAPKVEQTKSSKVELIGALKEAFAYCDKAYQGMTGASATQMVKLFGRDTPKLSVLSVNSLHNAEHYGNLVTYMRLKNIVPPSSEAQTKPKETEQKKQP